jgi:hypothetical protein
MYTIMFTVHVFDGVFKSLIRIGINSSLIGLMFINVMKTTI